MRVLFVLVNLLLPKYAVQLLGSKNRRKSGPTEDVRKYELFREQPMHSTVGPAVRLIS